MHTPSCMCMSTNTYTDAQTCTNADVHPNAHTHTQTHRRAQAPTQPKPTQTRCHPPTHAPHIPAPEVPDVVEAAGAIGGAHGLERELGLELAQLEQHHGQVVHEEQSVHQRDGVLHDALVVAVPRVQDAHAIEEPVGDNQEEDEHHEQRAEDEDAWEESLGTAEEERPAAQQEDEEFEGHGDEKPLAGRPAGLQLLPPQQLGQQHEGERGEEGEQSQRPGQRDAQVP